MKIIPLSEGSFTIDKTKQFVPYVAEDDSDSIRKGGALLVEIQPFLVETSQDLLLLDAGLGFTLPDGELQIHRNLRQAGFRPEDITKVLLTHLHKDHAGGISIENNTVNEYRMSFPEATYYVQEHELTYALETGLPSFVPRELVLLATSPQVVKLNGSGTIDDYISYALSGGHSPWHQVFTIRERGQVLFFGGDEAPQLHQMNHRFIAKYDHDGRKAMEMRQEWWAKGSREGWTFLFYHDVKTPFHKA